VLAQPAKKDTAAKASKLAALAEASFRSNPFIRVSNLQVKLAA
jgi:hypothetical protein